jgi:hypothetical protein
VEEFNPGSGGDETIEVSPVIIGPSAEKQE